VVSGGRTGSAGEGQQSGPLFSSAVEQDLSPSSQYPAGKASIKAILHNFPLPSRED